MKLKIIVILLAVVGIATGLAQLGEEYVTITVTSEGKAKISQTLFPKTFVSTIDVHIISEKISNLLAIDEKNLLLGTTQNEDLLKIATLGASTVDLKYNADILTYESGVFRLKYTSETESKVNLPPLSKLVSLNTIPIEITDEEYVLPPGDISLSYTIRPVTSKEFFVPVDNSEQKVETITAAKVEEFSANSDEISFIIKDKAIVLTIIPKLVMTNPNDALLNGEEVDFSQFHQNATHSWVRIDPHEKGLVRILNDESSEGGGCLIATATYGSEMAPQVQLLREIRDNQLMNTGSGVSFMTGFNQLYYLFSPNIADLERENPAFKEFVKIAITPMLSSLSIMTFAESEREVLGFGIGVILINIGMYFVLPFVIFYHVRNNIRTRGMKKSNWEVISSCNVLSVVKKGLFGTVVLLVLSVSVSSTFFESAYAEGEDPIQVVLDITHQNLLDSLDDAGIDPATDPYYMEAKTQYDAAMDALNEDDPNITDAKNSALIAMALFEKSAEEIGSLEGQASTQIPPGLNTAVTNLFEVQERITDSDKEVEELRQLAESNGIDVNFEEYDSSVNLAKEVLANGEIPNAQTQLVLANQIKDDLYDKIDAAVAEKQPDREEEFVESTRETIQEMVENGENLGLTKKAISELEQVLDAIENGETDEVLEKTSDKSELAKELDENDGPGNSENAPGQSNEDTAPGNSENAPGQSNEDTAPGNSENAPGQSNEDTAPGNSENAPGQSNEDTAPGNSENAPGQSNEDTAPGNSENTNGNGQGLEKVPPGLAKLFGYDDGTGDNEDFEAPEDLPSGFEAAINSASDTGLANGQGFENGQGLGAGNIPPGQLKKLDYSEFGTYSPDDYFDDATEDLREDSFEDNFDKMNKNSKAKEKKEKKLKDAEDARLDRAANGGSSSGGNGVGNDTTICHNGVITINVSSNALSAHIPGHPGDTLGACVEGVTDNEGNASVTAGIAYTVENFASFFNGMENTGNITLDIFARNGTAVASSVPQGYLLTPDRNGEWTITADAPPGNIAGTDRILTVTGASLPTAYAGPDQDVDDEGGTTVVQLDGSGSSDTGGASPGIQAYPNGYSWVKTSGGSPITLSDANVANPTFTAPDVNPSGRTITFQLTVTDNDGFTDVSTVDIEVNNTG